MRYADYTSTAVTYAAALTIPAAFAIGILGLLVVVDSVILNGCVAAALVAALLAMAGLWSPGDVARDAIAKVKRITGRQEVEPEFDYIPVYHANEYSGWIEFKRVPKKEA